MTSQPTFTVIIPCYNRSNTIVQAVNSIFRQTYQEFQVVIVDDASTDDSIEVIRNSFDDPRITLIPLEKNLGVHGARNAGLDVAKSDYIVFLDSDDELLPEALSSFTEVVNTDDSLAIISAPYIDDDGNLTGLELDQSGYVTYEDLLCERISRPLKAGVPCLNRSLINDIRFVAPNLDFIFYRKMMRKGGTYYIAQPLGLYHRGDDVESLHIKRKKLNAELSMKRAVELDKYVEEFQNDLLDYCPDKLAYAAYGASVGLLLQGKKNRALKRVLQSLRYGRVTKKRILILILSAAPFGQVILRKLFQTHD